MYVDDATISEFSRALVRRRPRGDQAESRFVRQRISVLEEEVAVFATNAPQVTPGASITPAVPDAPVPDLVSPAVPDCEPSSSARPPRSVPVSPRSTTDAIEGIITHLLPLSEGFASSSSSAAVQLIQSYLYLVGRDQKHATLEAALTDAQTECTRLTAENERLLGSQERLAAVEEQNTKLQEELLLCRADVAKMAVDRDAAVTARDTLT